MKILVLFLAPPSLACLPHRPQVQRESHIGVPVALIGPLAQELSYAARVALKRKKKKKKKIGKGW